MIVGAANAPYRMRQGRGSAMATFGLIHGAWHGAWCWTYLVPELEALGHGALTVDMPVDRRDATTVDYADAAADAFRGAGELIVVAHSMAGLVAPLLADRLPLAGIAYLCAVLRRPGMRCADDRAAGLNVDISPAGFGKELSARCRGPELLARRGGRRPRPLSGCDRRRRRLGVLPAAPPEGLLDRPRRRWPIGRRRRPPRSSAPRTGRSTRRGRGGWRRTGSSVEPIELPGGHSPHFTRPRELAALLDRLARTTFLRKG